MPAIRCPSCAAASLEIVTSLELWPDDANDELQLQIIGCTPCGFTGIAVYAESRHGALSGESVNHRGYEVDAERVRALRELIEQCPGRTDRRCQCAAHRAFDPRRAQGDWGWLSAIRAGAGFSLES